MVEGDVAENIPDGSEVDVFIPGHPFVKLADAFGRYMDSKQRLRDANISKDHQSILNAKKIQSDTMHSIKENKADLDSFGHKFFISLNTGAGEVIRKKELLGLFNKTDAIEGWMQDLPKGVTSFEKVPQRENTRVRTSGFSKKVLHVNKGGDLLSVIILQGAGFREGLSLTNVRNVFVYDAMESEEDNNQIEARIRRLCSHKEWFTLDNKDGGIL